MADARVDAFIAGLPGWQRDVCRRVRALVHEADPEMEETIKRTDRPYFVLRGNVVALQATKDHVNVFLYDPGVEDPAGIINRGHDAKTGRQIAIYEGDALDEDAFRAIISQIADRNRAGGWRRL